MGKIFKIKKKIKKIDTISIVGNIQLLCRIIKIHSISNIQ